ncbi:MAG: class I SAM-dependent methyltransferase [Candidatus Zixiibacteriota bacterium]|nr:MAG: class I SAM-dependent methyltransferase [candidate division Zixibacteria bacterium]
MFDNLEKINHRPKPFEFYTAADLWTDEHISKQMLEYHLNEDVDLASRNRAFVEKSAAWMIERFNIGPGVRICDFGCGPGLYTTPFAEAGADVTGIDFSERSIRHARETAGDRGLTIDYVLQNYLEYKSDKKFDLISLIFCDFCPLSPQQRKTLLGIFRDHLAEGGAVLVDVISLKFFEDTKEARTYEYAPEGGFWSPEAYYMFLNTFKYDEEKAILNKHTIIERSRTREIFNWLQCFSLESLTLELKEAGLTVIEQYADVAGGPYGADSPQFTVVARAEP